MKLYQLTTNGLGDYYVLANDPSSAEKTLELVLDGNDYGFFMQRDVANIRLIANGYAKEGGRGDLDNRNNGVIIMGTDVAMGIVKEMSPAPAEPQTEPNTIVVHPNYESPKVEPMSDLKAGETLQSMDIYKERKMYVHGYPLPVTADIDIIFPFTGDPIAKVSSNSWKGEEIKYHGKEVIVPDDGGLPYIMATIYWITNYGPYKKYEEMIKMIKEGRISEETNEL